MSSLHALPVSGGRSIEDSELRSKYRDIFGDAYLAADGSMSGAVLDSFFRPKSSLARAQRIAAEAFGADSTFFITGGTTLANRVAIDAMADFLTATGKAAPRVLADRTSHQSAHFCLDRAPLDISYCNQRFCCDRHGRTWADVNDLVHRYREAAASGDHFDLVVLSGANYDGAMLDMRTLLTELLQHSESLNLIVDEAWSAINAFHPGLCENTALAAARHVLAENPTKTIRLIVTHSAHKSMSAIRQGSYLHVSGDDELVQRVSMSLYRNHTTSPSLPILASLDLARAQAELEGADLLDRSLACAQRLGLLVNEHPEYSGFSVEESPGHDDPWIVPDRTKVLLTVDPSISDACELRLRLARDYGLYVARVVDHAILINLHIGVTEEIFQRFLAALLEISTSGVVGPPSAGTDTGFLVAYPPGIPLRVPGQKAGSEEERRLTEIHKNNAELFQA
ncbi:hypothetical protein ND747_01295 [Frankia sp. R82]|nr:hypothetical protein [Frankia sp. R82]